MILRLVMPYYNQLCAPRVCGDDPKAYASNYGIDQCSPRMRG